MLGARNGVVEQRTRQKLPAVGIIADLFIKRLCDALNHAAMDLAGREERVDQRADVVDGDVVENVDDPGIRIDLDIGEINPDGEPMPVGS